jgi:hypothetical protein
VCNDAGTCIGSGADPYDLYEGVTNETTEEIPADSSSSSADSSSSSSSSSLIPIPVLTRCYPEDERNKEFTNGGVCNLGWGIDDSDLNTNLFNYIECRVCTCNAGSGTVAPNCIDIFDQIQWTVGGVPGLVFITIGIIVAIGAIFYGLCRIKGCPGYKSKDQKYGLGQLIRKNANYTIDGLGAASEVMLGDNTMSVIMRDINLPQHVARFYMHGLNTPSSPLRLQLNSSDRRKIAHMVDMALFDAFVAEFNSIMIYSKIKRSIYVALHYVMYPAAMMYLQANRRSLVAKLLHMLADYDYCCFLDTRVRDLASSLKVGFSPDHTTVFLDVLDLDYSESNRAVATSKDNTPRHMSESCTIESGIANGGLVNVSPSAAVRLSRRVMRGLHDAMLVPFSGEGSYFFPLFLDPNDILVKCVPKMPSQSTFIDKTWLGFVHDLNLALRCVNTDFLELSLTQVHLCLDRYMRGTNRDTLGSLEIELVKISYATDGTVHSGNVTASNNNESVVELGQVHLASAERHGLRKRNAYDFSELRKNNFEEEIDDGSLDRNHINHSAMDDTDFVSASDYANNVNNYAISAQHVSQQAYDDHDHIHEDDNSFESRGSRASDDDASESCASGDSVPVPGDSNQRQGLRPIANGSMVRVSEWNSGKLTRFRTGDKLGLYIVCHGGAHLSSLKSTTDSTSGFSRLGTDDTLPEKNMKANVKAVIGSENNPGFTINDNARLGSDSNTRTNLWRNHSHKQSWVELTANPYKTKVSRKSSRRSIRDVEIGYDREAAYSAYSSNDEMDETSSFGGDANDDNYHSSDDSVDNGIRLDKYHRRSLQTLGVQKADFKKHQMKQRNRRATFSPFGTGISDLMASTNEMTNINQNQGASRRMSASSRSQFSNPRVAHRTDKFFAQKALLTKWDDEELVAGSVLYVQPPMCHRPWVRCLRVATAHVQLNLPIHMTNTKTKVGTRNVRDNHHLPSVQLNPFWGRRCASCCCGVLNNWKSELSASNANNNNNDSNINSSSKNTGSTKLAKLRLKQLQQQQQGLADVSGGCQGCVVEDRVTLLILVFISLLILALADLASAFIFTVYLVSISGVAGISASLTGPFWMYVFIMPLVPFWSPFTLFISVVYRNSRLARYASASALFSCINILITTAFSYVSTVLLYYQSVELTQGSVTADTLSIGETFGFDKFLLLPLCMCLLKCIIVYLLQVFIALIEMQPPADRWQSLLYSRRTGDTEDSVAGANFF